MGCKIEYWCDGCGKAVWSKENNDDKKAFVRTAKTSIGCWTNDLSQNPKGTIFCMHCINELVNTINHSALLKQEK